MTSSVTGRLVHRMGTDVLLIIASGVVGIGLVILALAPAWWTAQSFAQGIAADADLVMVALATYTQVDPDRLAAFSPVVMQLLRGTFKFSGVIVSDDLGATAAVADIHRPRAPVISWTRAAI